MSVVGSSAKAQQILCEYVPVVTQVALTLSVPLVKS